MQTNKLPTIYDIKSATLQKVPFFFDHDTMRVFGQTMRSFKVSWEDKEKGVVYLWAKTKCTGSITKRWFIVGGDDLFLSFEDALQGVENASK